MCDVNCHPFCSHHTVVVNNVSYMIAFKRSYYDLIDLMHHSNEEILLTYVLRCRL